MNTKILLRLGQNIRSLRQQRGLTQEKLAELAGLHRTYLGGVERGERNISFINLNRVAQALEVNLSELVRGVDEK